MGLPFGHGKEKATIPYGVRGLLDGDAGELIVTEAALVAG
jgi:muramoyltetrapeptide carboxypeptidase LdcA involved in peptidoglycan recycling